VRTTHSVQSVGGGQGILVIDGIKPFQYRRRHVPGRGVHVLGRDRNIIQLRQLRRKFPALCSTDGELA
jgi:hypothetical protein